MSETEQNECNQNNDVLKQICEIEKNYRNNFEAQATLFKNFFNILTKKTPKERIEGIKDFISKQTAETRFDVLKKYGIKDEENKNVLYLGIPGSLGRSYAKVEDQVESLVEILSNKTNLVEIYNKLDENNVKVNATITSIMYLFFPNKFIPIAGPILPTLKKIDKNQDDIDTWEKYQDVIELLKEEIRIDAEKDFDSSFTISLSFASWLMENEIENVLNKFMDADINKPKNIILTGIPGTGKTYTIMEYLKNNASTIGGYEFVQFHPSYDYEDFIEGLKPVPSSNGQIEFKLVNGVFKELCKKAYADSGNTYVMVIDEINRANLSRVFGELLYCLEYRDEFVSTKMTTYINGLPEEDKKAYSVSIEKEHFGKFAIPSNVIILGTMNEVDRSIDAFDLALRRRFIWEDIGFNSTALRLYSPFFEKGFTAHIEDLIKTSESLNKKLSEDIGINYQLGHTYYFKIADYYDDDYASALCDLWEYHIKSIVREYCKIKFGENEINSKLREYKEIVVGKNNCNG